MAATSFPSNRRRGGDRSPSLPYRGLLDRSSDAFIAHDFLGRRVYSNPVYRRMIGIAEDAPTVAWGPFADWAPGTAKTVSVGMRRARDAALAGETWTEAVVTRLLHPSGQPFEATMQFEVVGSGDDMVALALVQPTERVAWLERRTGRDVNQIRALEDVIRSIATELSRVGVAPLAETAAVSATSRGSELTKLSAQEWKILQELMAGRRVPSIASHLSLSQHTVRNHLKGIFRKLDVHSQAELIERYRAIRGQEPQSLAPGA